MARADVMACAGSATCADPVSCAEVMACADPVAYADATLSCSDPILYAAVNAVALSLFLCWPAQTSWGNGLHPPHGLRQHHEHCRQYKGIHSCKR